MMKKILILILICSAGLQAICQNKQVINGFKKSTTISRGACVGDSIAFVATHDTVMPSWFPDQYHNGAIVRQTDDGNLYMYNRHTWLRQSPYQTITASEAIDFDEVDSLSRSSVNVTVPGVAAGDPVFLGVPKQTNGIFTAVTETDNRVTITFYNTTLNPINLTSLTFKIIVMKTQ